MKENYRNFYLNSRLSNELIRITSSSARTSWYIIISAKHSAVVLFPVAYQDILLFRFRLINLPSIHITIHRAKLTSF